MDKEKLSNGVLLTKSERDAAAAHKEKVRLFTSRIEQTLERLSSEIEERKATMSWDQKKASIEEFRRIRSKIAEDLGDLGTANRRKEGD